VLEWGRERFRDRAAAAAREWLCANGLEGFASGTASSVRGSGTGGGTRRTLDPDVPGRAD
jgi:hypothetical protein